jgi:hypothetical protein
LPGGLDDLDRLTLTLPQDYAGDGLHFNVRLVNTDTVSGDTKMVEKDVTLHHPGGGHQRRGGRPPSCN